MEIKEVISRAQGKMDKGLDVLNEELKGIRTGRASAGLLDRVMVDYYGTLTPIKQLSNINVPEAQLITITPWDKSTIGAIEKAIQGSEVGLTPSNDGNLIRLTLPPLTEERRRELTKVVHKFGEEAKIAVRNVRRDAIEELKTSQKDGKISEDEMYREQEHIQKITDQHTGKIDELVKAKEQEVMTV